MGHLLLTACDRCPESPVLAWALSRAPLARLHRQGAGSQLGSPGVCADGPVSQPSPFHVRHHPNQRFGVFATVVSFCVCVFFSLPPLSVAHSGAGGLCHEPTHRPHRSYGATRPDLCGDAPAPCAPRRHDPRCVPAPAREAAGLLPLFRLDSCSCIVVYVVVFCCVICCSKSDERKGELSVNSASGPTHPSLATKAKDAPSCKYNCSEDYHMERSEGTRFRGSCERKQNLKCSIN